MEETTNSKSPNKKILNEQTKLQEKYLSKLRDCHYSYLIELGKLHISFITELSYDVFDQELNSRYKDSDNNCGKPLVKCKKEKSRNHLSSGSSINDLDQINAFESEAITAAVDVLCSHLQKQENISQEGIFRKCGNVARQKELKGKLLELPHSVDFSAEHYTSHDCATVLKQLLGSTPEPLLQQKFLVAHMHSLDVSVLKKRKSMVCILIQMLSCVNFPLVRMVLLLLHKVAQHAANNLMNADNLGTIFTPHMFYPKDISQSERTDLQELSAKMTSVVSFMITHAPEIILPPRLLAIDALTYLRKKRAELGTSEDSLTSLGSISSGSNLAATKRKHCNDETDEAEAPIHTVVTFGSRCPGKVEHDTTAIELAKLHAHVQNMEDSNTKRMFLKRVNENSHKKDSTCKSIGDSIKRTFSKRYRSKSRSKTPEKVLESPATLPASKSKCTQTATTPKVKLPLLNTSVELLQESPYPLHRAAVRNLCKAEGGLSRGKNTPEFSPIHNSRAGTESQQPAASTPLSHKSPLKPTNQNSSDGCWQPSLKKTKPSKVLMVYHKKLDDMKDHPATPPRVSGKMTLNDSGFNC